MATTIIVTDESSALYRLEKHINDDKTEFKAIFPDGNGFSFTLTDRNEARLKRRTLAVSRQLCGQVPKASRNSHRRVSVPPQYASTYVSKTAPVD